MGLACGGEGFAQRGETVVDGVLVGVVARSIQARSDLVDRRVPQLLAPEEGEGNGEHPVRLRALLAVRPRIELKAYKGIPVTSPRRKASPMTYPA
mgnify:CR=1 FL=1